MSPPILKIDILEESIMTNNPRRFHICNMFLLDSDIVLSNKKVIGVI